MALDKFISMIEGFLRKEIATEEFIARYLQLRRKILAEAREDPDSQREQKKLLDSYKTREITQETFSKEFRRIAQEHWPPQYRELLPFTQISDLLMGRLIIIVDSFDNPGYRDLAIDEDELRLRVAEILDSVRREKKRLNDKHSS